MTVRLVGYFGCLCFMLSANANILDKIVDEGENKKAKRLALAAPAFLLVLAPNRHDTTTRSTSGQ